MEMAPGINPEKHPARMVSPIHVFTGYPSLVTSRKWKVHNMLILDVTRYIRHLYTCLTKAGEPWPSTAAALAAKIQLPAFLDPQLVSFSRKASSVKTDTQQHYRERWRAWETFRCWILAGLKHFCFTKTEQDNRCVGKSPESWVRWKQ